MENKFNIGDRVRFIREDCHWIEISIHNGDEGVVVGNGSGYFHNSVDVNFGGASDEISADDLELVEPYDPKTAFLSELKALLEKYGASIMLDAKGSYCGDDVECVTMSSCLNNNCINYTITDFDKEITADNIMDYDKD